MNKRSAGLYSILILFLLFFFLQISSAAMPPHIESSIPEDDGILLGDTVRFYGYTLKHGDHENIKVIDLTAGGEVETSIDIDCATEGEGDAPGCEQPKCILAITLTEIMPDHEYEISFKDTSIEFVPTFHFVGSDEDAGEDQDLDGISDKQGDCDDNNPEIYPGAIERCSDNVDRDCDGDHSVCCRSIENGSSGGGCIITSLPVQD